LADDGCLQIDALQIGVFSLKTNDLIEISGKGFRILGRKDNVVISGGIKLFPEQIEKKLEGLFENLFFLIGVHDDKYGEKLVLVIERKNKPEPNENQLWKLIKNKLTGFEIPKEIIFTEEIETTSNGKIIRSL